MKTSGIWFAVTLLVGAAPAFASEWTIVALDRAPVIGEPSLIFSEEGLPGNTGCNGFQARGGMQDGALVMSGPVAATRMACPGEGLAAQDETIIAAFSGRLAVSLDLFTDQVVLSSETTSMVLTRRDSVASEAEGPQVRLGRDRPGGDPAYLNPFGLAGDLPLHDAPDTTSSVVGGVFSGKVLRNEDCDGDWCWLEALDGSVIGWGERAYLEASNAILRVGQGVFDVVAGVPCAKGVGAPMTGCATGAARGDDGSATVVVTKPDGNIRVLYFDGGAFVGSDTSQAGGGFESSATREGDLSLIRVDNERCEIPDAVFFRSSCSPDNPPERTGIDLTQNPARILRVYGNVVCHDASG